MKGIGPLAAALLTAVPGAALAQPAEVSWIRIEARRLLVQPGTTVEICGAGHLEFIDGRRAIAIRPGAVVRVAGENGTQRESGSAVVEIRGPGSDRWIVRRTARLPISGGTTIRDSKGSGSAAVDASAPTRFWLAVEPDGRAVFFQPDDGGAACDSEGASDVAHRIDRTLDRFSDYGFSGAALVARAGDLIFTGGYGLADREREIPVRPSTIFEVGSLTKQFTAAAVLRLAERGLLSIDDTLGATWSLPAPVAGITIHQLLSHTSGLPEDFPEPPVSRAAVVDALRRIDPAGEGFAYSNLGYVVLAALIEEKTDATYANVLEDLFFEPLALESTGVYRPDAWPDALLAVGYSGTFGSGLALDPHPVRPTGWDLLGASGVVASLPDLHRWVRALWGGEVLGEESLRRMFTPYQEEFGYGWIVYETARGTRGILHGGDTRGVQSYAGIYPDEDLVVLLAVNDRRGWRGPVYDTVVGLALGQEVRELPPPTADLETRELDRWSGAYRLPDGARIEVRPTGDGLVLGAEGQSAVALVTSPSAEERAALEERNAAAAAFMAALSAGDSAAVREDLAPSGRPESFGVVWSALTEGHGPLTAYEVLGTAPDRASRRITFVRLHFDDGHETLRLVWRPHLDGWGTGGERPRREFRPLGEAQFATYDIFSGRTIRIRFHEEGGGRAIEFLDAPEAPRARS